MNTPNHVEHRQAQPEYEPDPHIWNMAVDFIRRSSWSVFRPNAMWLMQNLGTDAGQAMLKGLNYDLQRQLFEELAEDDSYETLNFSYLYKNKPFGMQILQKAALDCPDTAVEYIERYPDDPEYQKLHRFLIQRLGKEKMQRETERLRSSFMRRLVCGL